MMVELPEPEVEGWLAQRGSGLGGSAKRVWRRRYYALSAETNALEFYERARGKDGSGGKKGEIDLTTCRTIRASQARDKRPHEIGAFYCPCGQSNLQSQPFSPCMLVHSLV